MSSSVQQAADRVVAQSFPTLLNLVIVRHGLVALERAYHQGELVATSDVKSVTKSIISALVGIALREGYLTSLDQRIEEFLPEYVLTADDQRKRAISLRHLLTLRSGLKWDERSAECWPALVVSSNWIEHGLRLPRLYPPGEVFTYSTLDAHLLSAILSRATGMDMLTFANRYLFGPLGCVITTWQNDPQGYQIGGTGLHLAPRDLAKVGYLYLRRGRWEDSQLLPEDYLSASTCVQVTPQEGVYALAAYGYLWWVARIGACECFYALGYGGQLVCVIPEVDIVMVVTARLDVPPSQGAGEQVFTMARELTERIIFPALL